MRRAAPAGDGRREKRGEAHASAPLRRYLDAERYPLFAVKTKDWAADKPHLLVTGGVHGYETSGVQGALLFLDSKAEQYSKQFNIVVLPCVSPWGYECIQRWNAIAEDPNRAFRPERPAEEARRAPPRRVPSPCISVSRAGLGASPAWCCTRCKHAADGRVFRARL